MPRTETSLNGLGEAETTPSPSPPPTKTPKDARTLDPALDGKTEDQRRFNNNNLVIPISEHAKDLRGNIPEMSANYVAPGQHRSLRACMVCSVVRTSQKFQSEGCPNCESFLNLAGNPDAIAECTSQVFEGVITLADPAKSWVARWQRIDGYVAGVYASKVVGILPEDVIVAVEDAGLRYIPRDGSEMDDAPPEP